MSIDPVELTHLDTDQTLDSLLHQVLNQALVAVGAEGGSLMMVDNRRGILQIKARLGPPRAGRKTEVVYHTNETSVAAWVVRNKKSYLCRDVDGDSSFIPSRHGKNFSSLLSVPIIADGKVLAVINADARSKNQFSDTHRELLEQIAEKAAGPIVTRISIPDAVAQVALDLAGSPRQGNVEDVLRNIAQLAVRSLGADIVTLYQYVGERDEFLVEGTGPTIAGNLRDPGPMHRKVFEGDVPWTVVKNRHSDFYVNVHDHGFLNGVVDRPGDLPRPRFIDREGIESMAALLLPFRAEENPGEEVVGVMFANYRTRHQFNIDEIAALATFANYAAAAILNARHEERRRFEQVKLAEAFSANLAHRMSHLAGPTRFSALILRDHFRKTGQASGENAWVVDELNRIVHEIELMFKLSERLALRFKDPERAIGPEMIDVRALIEGLLNQVNKRVTLIKDLPAELPKVECDALQLRQVVHDVVENAVEAMADKPDPRLTVRAYYDASEKQVHVEVTDNGPGIPDKLQDSLFVPAGTTKEGRLGIGLWFCRTFMRAIGGDMVLKNTALGLGTTFDIMIPYRSPEDVGGPLDSRGRPLKDILIVDDAPRFRETLLLALKDEGYTIETAASLADAREALAAARFKLAILDIRLIDGEESNLDGLRLLHDIERTNRRTKVILITGWKEAEKHLPAGSNPSIVGFLKKEEIDPDRYRSLVRNAVTGAGQ